MNTSVAGLQARIESENRCIIGFETESRAKKGLILAISMGTPAERSVPMIGHSERPG